MLITPVFISSGKQKNPRYTTARPTTVAHFAGAYNIFYLIFMAEKNEEFFLPRYVNRKKS